MAALVLLLAALASTPVTPTRQGIISIQDYPQSALDHGEEGSVATRLVVNPKGRVESCKVIISSGFADLDATTCRLLTTRARFSPALAEDGTPIYGLYRSLITWSLDPNKRVALGPDAEITLNRAPAGVPLPAEISVSYIIAANGKLRNCKSAPDAIATQLLVDLACQELSRAPQEIIRNSNGQPIEASNTAKVRFRTSD